MATAPHGFTGFPKSAMQFFHELGIEMSREWFAANKARYEAQWVTPMQALLTGVRAGLVAAYRPLVLDEPKVQRIHRDVRFSKDKTPYKTHIGAGITLAGSTMSFGGIAAIYLQIGLQHGTDDELCAVGTYLFDAPTLARWRTTVASKRGGELQMLVEKLRRAGYEIGGHHAMKRVPKGFPAEHPRAELLKMRGLTGSFPAIPRGLLHQRGLTEWLVGHGTAMAPLVTWLHKYLG